MFSTRHKDFDVISKLLILHILFIIAAVHALKKCSHCELDFRCCEFKYFYKLYANNRNYSEKALYLVCNTMFSYIVDKLIDLEHRQHTNEWSIL